MLFPAGLPAALGPSATNDSTGAVAALAPSALMAPGASQVLTQMSLTLQLPSCMHMPLPMTEGPDDRSMQTYVVSQA